MNQLKLRRRLTYFAFVCLEIIYVLAGFVFISARNAGGVSLGVLFLGAAALLHLSLRFLDELQRIRFGLIRSIPLEVQKDKQPATLADLVEAENNVNNRHHDIEGDP